MREVGLFCGTFNPIHVGHLLIAECARDQFKLERVLFVTSPRPPHRDDVYLEGEARFDMVAQAVADNPSFEASPVEINRAGPSYTIDTVNHFANLYGSEARINLLVGGDNVNQLETWHKIDEMYELVRLLIAPRAIESARVQSQDKSKIMPKQLLADLQEIGRRGAKYELIDFPLVDISSSMIRSRLAAGKSVLYMVPLAVNNKLIAEGYYKNSEQRKKRTECL